MMPGTRSLRSSKLRSLCGAWLTVSTTGDVSPRLVTVMLPLLAAPELFSSAANDKPSSVTAIAEIQGTSALTAVSGRDQILLSPAATV